MHCFQRVDNDEVHTIIYNEIHLQLLYGHKEYKVLTYDKSYNDCHQLADY